MSRRPKFTLVFAPEAVNHLDAIERKYHSLIRRTIDSQLYYVPAQETRNRKPLDQPAPFGEVWELRCGAANQFRVFYEVDIEGLTVSVLAIGVKHGNRLFFGGEEFEL